MSRLYLASQCYKSGKAIFSRCSKRYRRPHLSDIVDILRNTNFFISVLWPLQCFSAVPTFSSFWNSIKYDEKTGALDITPVNLSHPFELPPTGDTVIDFVNQLGYPEPIEFKGKPSLQLVDEESEAQQEPEPQREGDDPALELAKKLSLETHQEKGEGEGADVDIGTKQLSLLGSFLSARQGHAPV
ncbi:hypothetical protein Tco_0550434 [Tanacetum coccineum]